MPPSHKDETTCHRRARQILRLWDQHANRAPITNADLITEEHRRLAKHLEPDWKAYRETAIEAEFLSAWTTSRNALKKDLDDFLVVGWKLAEGKRGEDEGLDNPAQEVSKNGMLTSNFNNQPETKSMGTAVTKPFSKTRNTEKETNVAALSSTTNQSRDLKKPPQTKSQATNMLFEEALARALTATPECTRFMRHFTTAPPKTPHSTAAEPAANQTKKPQLRSRPLMERAPMHSPFPSLQDLSMTDPIFQSSRQRVAKPTSHGRTTAKFKSQPEVTDEHTVRRPGLEPRG